MNVCTNRAPFAVVSSSSSNQYNPVTILSTPGFYELQATPHTGLNASGNTGPIHVLFLSVLAGTRVANLTWIDATTHEDISVYTNVTSLPAYGPNLYFLPHYELDPRQYPINSTFTIRANPAGTVGSAEFNLTYDDNRYGSSFLIYNLVYRYVANDGPPYCMGGRDVNGNCLAVPRFQMPGNISSGVAFNYQLLVTPFSKANQQGDEGPTETFSLGIRPNFQILSFSIVDASTGKDLLDVDLSDTAKLFLNLFRASTRFTIRANTYGNVGSIAFTFSFYVSSGSTLLLDPVENKSPFTAAGVSNVTGQLYNPISSLLVPGMYVATRPLFLV